MRYREKNKSKLTSSISKTQIIIFTFHINSNEIEKTKTIENKARCLCYDWPVDHVGSSSEIHLFREVG